MTVVVIEQVNRTRPLGFWTMNFVIALATANNNKMADSKEATEIDVEALLRGNSSFSFQEFDIIDCFIGIWSTFKLN